jgi:hypothetical protein
MCKQNQNLPHFLLFCYLKGLPVDENFPYSSALPECSSQAGGHRGQLTAFYFATKALKSKLLALLFFTFYFLLFTFFPSSLKPHIIMAAITKRFIAGLSAAAERIDNIKHSLGAIGISDTTFSAYDHWPVWCNVNRDGRFRFGKWLFLRLIHKITQRA